MAVHQTIKMNDQIVSFVGIPQNLQEEIKAAVAGTNTHVIIADTDFAGDDMDAPQKRLATFEALEMALEDEYDHVVFILIDFLSENTDTIFCPSL